MATLAVVLSPQTYTPAVSLYSLEEQLVALAETVDLVVPEKEEAFLADFQQALSAAVDKRDRVAQFMAHLENQINFAKTEIQRLQDRKDWYEKTLDALKQYVIRVIRGMYEPDKDGRYPKLEGRTTTFSLRAKPAMVEYLPDGESLVPAVFKTLTIKLPAERWEQLLDSLDMETAGDLIDAVKKAEASIDKRAVKAALDAEVPVPGAYLDGATAENRKYSLVRK